MNARTYDALANFKTALVRDETLNPAKAWEIIRIVEKAMPE